MKIVRKDSELEEGTEEEKIFTRKRENRRESKKIGEIEIRGKEKTGGREHDQQERKNGREGRDREGRGEKEKKRIEGKKDNIFQAKEKEKWTGNEKFFFRENEKRRGGVMGAKREERIKRGEDATGEEGREKGRGWR